MRGYIDYLNGVPTSSNAVVEYTSTDELDNAKYLEAYGTIRDNLLNTERGRSYTNWLTNARKSIEKEDYRSEVY